MELMKLDNVNVGNIAASVIASLIWVSIASLWAFGLRFSLTSRLTFFLRTDIYARTIALLISSVPVGLIATALVQLLFGTSTPFWQWSLVYLVMMLIGHDIKFNALGFHSAELKINSGTTYDASLKLCRDGFAVLGTGASKLTSSTVFEETIKRCSHDPAKVRFLLLRPDNQILLTAANQAGVSSQKYQSNVKRSLQILQDLRLQKNYDFEVRFYNEPQVRGYNNFRMMFVDDNILLLSYNSYGSGDGSQLPQVVLKRDRFRSTKDNFYLPFSRYFEDLWKVADPWDFQQFL